MAKSQPSMMFLTTTSLTATQKKLFNSPLFQLSNGSKELFHSNFLYWLSIVDWDMFVFVMRHLAGLSNRHKFRWEANHSPSKNNIKVLREHNHFDLSIYILDGKKWLPVLVLENKVKSFPDYKQLAGYEQKAMAYGIVGGTPQYLLQINDRLTIEENVKNIRKGREGKEGIAEGD